MTNETINEKLLSAFPELEKTFGEYISWQEDIGTGCFLVYEDLFVPVVIKTLEEGDAAKLAKAADLIEDLYTSRDEYAENLIYVGVLEALKSKAKEREKELMAVLHEKSAKAFAELTY